MHTFPALFAYFGPEVQLPVISFIAAAAGLLFTIGTSPIRVIKRWLAARREKAESSRSDTSAPAGTPTVVQADDA